MSNRPIPRHSFENAIASTVLSARRSIGITCGLNKPVNVGPYKTDQRLLAKPVKP